ncbi:MAG: endolytic transglycosylase MltG [Patescibacteria group bacterium]
MSKYFKTILLYIFFALLILALLGIVYFNYIIRTPVGLDSTKQIFEIPDKTATIDVADNLLDKKLIKSDWVFVIYVKLTHKTLRAGSYLLSEDMSIKDIATKISSGDTAIRKITIPEGWRAEQIAQYLSEKKYVNYADFMAQAYGYDGKLFPDTYYISVKSTASDIVRIMNDNYNERTKSLNLTDSDLILASIVEREAKKDADRPIIAGIFKNRLNIDMKLESNPTVQYGFDSMQIENVGTNNGAYDFWDSTDGRAFSTINSPFNTYLYAGLPPEPICNPGLKSIEAVINYTHSNYYYFITDDDGTLHPAATAAEHQANVNKYLR